MGGYTIWEAMKAQPQPCPACEGASVHRRDCPIMEKKRLGFALVLGVPLLIVAVLFDAGFDDWLPAAIGAALGCALTGVWYRWRVGRDRSSR